MNELLERIYDEARSAWRFRWIGLAAAAAVAILGWVVVFALPDRYEARASVFVDTRTALRPALQGLTVEQDVNVQLNYVRQSLLSGERLESIARASDVLPAAETDPRRIAEILDQFAERVTLGVSNASPSGREAERDAGSIYSFRYQDGDRERSLKVVRTVVNTFVEETLGGKRAGAEGAQKFMEDEMKTLEARLREAENELAEFKKANVGLMPTEQGGAVAQLQATLDAVATLENDLNVALAERAELARQLRGDAVLGATAAPSMGNAGAGDTVSRINEAQARYDDLLLRFTERHPDVIAAKSTLDDLKARRAREVELMRVGDPGAVASSGVSSNPVYQSIQQQLNQADVRVASLRGQLSQQRTKAANLNKRLADAPQVEAEYAQLNRDYEVVNAQYTALLENYEKARLGERADDAGSVRFEVIQPPDAPYGPVFPNRVLFLAGVLVAALGLGGGLSYLIHLLGPVVGSLRGLSDLTDLPILGVVSAAFPSELAARARGELLRFVAVGGLLFVAFAAALALNMIGVRFSASGAS